MAIGSMGMGCFVRSPFEMGKFILKMPMSEHRNTSKKPNNSKYSTEVLEPKYFGGIRANLKAPANPANTSAMYHGGKLLALNEGGRPWQLEPSDLTTIGEFNYDGGLSRGNVFSAHGKVHSQTGDYINFGAGISKVKWSGVQACLNVYRINKAGKPIKRVQSL